MVVAGILAGALAVWISLPHATGPALHWVLASNGSRVELPPETTVIKIRTDYWPACPPYEEDLGNVANSSWLVPEVSYSTSSVTITLHESSTYDSSACPGFYDYWGLPVEIKLREPLGGRVLLDGWSVPAEERPYH